MTELKKIKNQSILECLAEKLKVPVDDISVHYESKNGQNHFSFNFKKQIIASFTFAPMPGCCGVVISTAARTHEFYRKLGIGVLMNTVRLHIAKKWNYSLIMCTDVEKNEPQQKILKKNGWSKLTTFTNSKTNNKVCVHSTTPRLSEMSMGFEIPNQISK